MGTRAHAAHDTDRRLGCLVQLPVHRCISCCPANAFAARRLRRAGVRRGLQPTPRAGMGCERNGQWTILQCAGGARRVGTADSVFRSELFSSGTLQRRSRPLVETLSPALLRPPAVDFSRQRRPAYDFRRSRWQRPYLRSENAMKNTKRRLSHSARMVLGVIFALEITGFAACSSTESTTGGRLIDSPRGIHAGDAGKADATSPLPDGSASACSPIYGCYPPPTLFVHVPTGSEAAEKYGVKLTAEQKVIADTCPRVPWSKNVPNRTCQRNDECGDGFCDRGKCTAILTCFITLGSPCEKDGQCPFMMCIDGHCSSCISDEECQERLEHPDRKCTATQRHAPGRECTRLDGNPGMDWKAICAQRTDHPKCQDGGR